MEISEPITTCFRSYAFFFLFFFFVFFFCFLCSSLLYKGPAYVTHCSFVAGVGTCEGF